MKNRCCLLYLVVLILSTLPLTAADTLIPLGAVWKYLDNGSDQGTAWRQPGFNDSTWASGQAELGYGDNDEATVISYGGTGSISNNNKHITYYFRRSFNIPNPAAYALLRGQLKRDDGAVVYLNGVEIHRANILADPVLYSTRAQNDSDDGRSFHPFTASTSNLVAGVNVIAVEVHQDGPTSSDVSFNFELVGSENNPPVAAIDSPGNGARFTAPANIQIRAAGSDIDGNLALVELFTGTTKLAESPGSFVFQTNNLPIGSYSFYAIATDAFGLRTISSVVNIFVDPSTPPVIASRSPAPGNVTSLQRITIHFSEPVTGLDATDLLINGLPATSVSGTGTNYLFEFPQPADGLVLITWNGQHNIADFENPPRPFDPYAPGATWQYTLADSVPPSTTQISPAPGATLRSLNRITVTFSEPVTGLDAADLLINNLPANALTGSGAGPYEFSFSPPTNGPVTVRWSATADVRDFAGARNLFAGGTWNYTLNPAAIFEGNIVINEIMYHPATERDDHEWIELHNRGTNLVNLAGWSLSRGANFTLPAVTLAPGGYLVLAADTNAFRIVYPAVANVVGGWDGRLSNTSEDIELEDANGNRVDLVSYADQGDWAQRRRATISGNTNGWEWLAPHDGEGRTLELRNAALENNAGQNWSSSLTLGGTPGTRNTAATTNLPPLILDAAHFPVIPRSTDPITITARLADDQGGVQAVLRWRNASTTSPGSFNTTTMFDDGGHGDGAAGDGVFGAILGAQANRTILEYYISAQGTDDQGSNDRTWPAPAHETNSTTAGQLANALLQVDDEVYTGNQPVYRLIMTESDRTTFNSHNRNIEAEFNVTFVAIEGGGTSGARAETRHNAGLRYRGAGSRGRNPPTMRLNFRTDQKWNNKSAINLNSQAPHSQVIGGQLSVLSGMPSEYARAVQLRLNGVNLATAAMFGSYAAVEATNGETVGEHLPDDGDGNVYRASTGAHSATLNYLGTNPQSYINAGYNKTSNKTENDWRDLMALTFAMDPATTPDSDYVTAVRRNVNVDLWLRYFAMCSIMEYTETSLGSGRGDDYGLYRGLTDPRFIILTHDFDTIFNQGDTGGTVDESIYVATAVGTISRFLFHPEFNALYQAELRRLLATTYSTNHLFPVIDQFLGDWVAPQTITGMKTFITARNASILAQLGPEPAPAPRATITGEPATPTFLNTATLAVSGTAITHYRYRLNGGTYGNETPVGTPIELSNLADGSYTISVIGRDSAGTWQSESTPTYSRTWTVLSGLRRVVINEVLARNVAAVPINGGFPDLIELYNPRAIAVDITGLRLTDDLNAPNRFVFPAGTTIPAGGHLILIAANADGSPGIHLGFQLDQNGETLHLLDSTANGGAVLDSVQFGPQLPDLSVGRVAGGHWALCSPTFGAANTATATGDPSAIRINEWLASGVPPLLDDFVELYNPSALPVAIGGHYFSDLPGSRPFRHRLTPLSFLPGFGYRAFIADGQPELGNDHLGFKLSSSLGEIGLHRPDGSIIDFVIYGLQQDGISQGRVPNGGPQIKFLATPTPGAPNPVPPTPVPPLTINLLPLDTNVLWRYNDTGANLGTAWTANAFDDSGWPAGPALLAFDTDLFSPPAPIRTPLAVANGRITFYFRTHFNVPANLNISELQATYAIDDGAVFHINGTEAGRFNMPSGNIGFNTTANLSHEASSFETISLSLASLVPGDNVIAVEVHQQSSGSSDIVFGMRLDAVILTNSPTSAGIVLSEVLANNLSVTNADGSVSDWVEILNPSNTAVDLAGMSLTDTVDNPRRWIFPAGSIIAANSRLVVRFDDSLPASTNASASLNTGFGLNASGDEVYLFNQPATGGELLSAIVFGLQAPDLSIGRNPADGTNWIATLPTPGTDNIAATLGNPALIRINEWMADPSSGDDWIELFNANPQVVALGGVSITDDLNDRSKNPFPPLSFMAAGSRGHLRLEADNNPGAGANHLNFKLSGSGESIGLFSSAGTLIDSITFGTQIEGVSQGRLPDGAPTIVSFPGHATPGDANFLTLAGVVINEVLTHSTPPREDAIEIHNTSLNAIDISGWYLSDSQNNPLKFRIPANTILPAGGFAVFYENQFNILNPGTPFSLSSARGDEVFLSQATGPATLSGYRASASFGAAAEGVSFGRHITSVGVDFTALVQTTFGEDTATTVEGFRAGTGLANAAPLVGPVVIGEIMYHPPDVITAGVTNDNELDEFIELRNLTATPVPLFDGPNAWRLRDAVDFEFPTNFTLAADARLVVVSFDPTTNAVALADFRARYGIDGSVTVLGPWRGRLANNSENIELYRPDAPVAAGLPDAGLVPFILVDRVRYADTLPWPSLADGGTNGAGLSLHRRFSAAYGNDPVSWIAAAPTPGSGNAPAALIPPGITSFTPPQAVAPGGSVTLTVAASGGGTLVYEWRKNGNLIAGASTASLTITSFQAASVGTYSVIVANGAGSASASTQLELGAPPVVARPPANQIVEPGGTATFSVLASGTGLLGYQWQRSIGSGVWELVNGANAASLSLANVQLADAASFRAIVTNAFGAVTSAPASLSIVSPPVIVTQPVGTNILVGQNASFFVTVAGTAPFRYQWLFNNTIEIPGATNASLLLTNLPAQASGTYSVRVSNAIGSVTSSNAILLVEPPPSASVTATDVVATEPGAGAATDTASFTFTRTKVTDQPQEVFFTVSGSATPGADYAALVSPVVIPAGSNSVTLTLTPLDDSLVESNEFVFVTVVAGPGYVPGESPQAVAILVDDDNQRPVVTITSPTNNAVVVFPGSVAITATATDPDGSITKVEFYANGTNRLGEDLTAPYGFTWTNPPAGVNFIVVIAVDNLGASAGVGQQVILNNPPSVSLTSPSDGTIIAPGSDVAFAANASDSDGTIALVEFFADGVRLGSDSTPPYRFTWFGPADGPYNLAAQATDNRGTVRVSTPVKIYVGVPPPVFGDTFAARGIVTGYASTVPGTNITFTREAGEPRHASRSGNHSGWLSWTAPASGLCRIDTFGSDFDTLLAVYTGGTVSNLTVVSANDDANGDTILSAVAFNATNGVTYHIAVDGYGTNGTIVGGNAGRIVLNLALPNPYPVFTTQPQSLVVTQGNTVVFRAVVGGPGPQTYRWRFNGANITGATSTNLTLNNVQAAQAGNYTLVASNSAGATTSAVATLIVQGPPVIASQPQNMVVPGGGTATFSVSATGIGPFAYQWRLDGIDLSGATSSNLVLQNVQGRQEGLYSVAVTSPLGTTPSTGASLVVDDGLRVNRFDLLFNETQSWRYHALGGNLGTAWRFPGFDDTGWSNGAALFGLESPGVYQWPLVTPFPLIGTNGSGTITFYFRTTFALPSASEYTTLVAEAYVDDGAVWYLNGREGARLRLPTNIPVDGMTSTTTASTAQEGVASFIALPLTNAVAGENLLSVEVHQQSATSSDVVFGMALYGSVALTNGPSLFPPVPNGTGTDVTLNGISGRDYALEVSTNLVNWSTAATWTNFTGSATYLDPASLAPGTGTRFYRGKLVR